MMENESTNGSVALQWPNYANLRHRPASQVVKPLFSFRFLSEFLIISLGLTSYALALVLTPALFPQEPIAALRDNAWWAIDLALNLGSGGAFIRPGLWSVGLLGGVLSLHKTHLYLRAGNRVRDSLLMPRNVVLTILVTAGMTLMYWYYSASLPASTPWLLFLASLAGSAFIQWADAAFYRRTGVSLVIVNLGAGLLVMLNEAVLDGIAQMLVLAVIGGGTLAVILRRARPIRVPVEVGEPPRSEMLEPFISVDFRLLNALGLSILLLGITGQAVWNLLLPKGTLAGYAMIGGLIVLAALIEGAFRLNRRFGVIEEVDVSLVHRYMKDEMMTVRDVAPGSATLQYYADLLRKSQRMAFWFMLSLLAGVGLLVGGVAPTDLSTGLLILVAPLLVSVWARHGYALYTHLQSQFRRARQAQLSPLDADFFGSSMVRSEAASSLSPPMSEDGLRSLVDKAVRVMDELPMDADINLVDLQAFLREKGIIDKPTPAKVVRVLLEALIKGIPSERKKEEVQHYSEAWRIIGKNLRSLFFSFLGVIVVSIISLALAASLFGFSISGEAIVLFILGIQIPLLIPYFGNRRFMSALRLIWTDFSDRLMGYFGRNKR